MRIDLSKYLTERYLDSVSKQEFEGPVVTISREFGCPGQRIAAELATRLTNLKSPKAKPIPHHVNIRQRSGRTKINWSKEE